MSQTVTLAKVNDTSPMPKYLQAREILTEAIRSGTLLPGAKLPSTQELSAQFNISLITAQKALEGLVESGWLRREVGRGTFVRDDVLTASQTSRKVSVGLLFDETAQVNFNDFYHSTLIDSLRLAAREDADQIEFFFQESLAYTPRNRDRVGAICIHPPTDAVERVRRLSKRVPTVVLGGSFPGTALACVDCDNTSGAQQAVQHLLELGHQRIMVLSGPMNLSNSRDRARGATNALVSNGLLLDTRDVIVSREAITLDADARAAVERRLSDVDRPTAVVAGGFYLALAAIQAARSAGLSIPDDLSVVGFDDPASAPLLAPPLTTVRQPLAEMAELAFRLLRRMQQDPQTPAGTERLATELVVRESTAPPH
jgi:GntR family transcriptional regulator, arabinose operon transcriptional repressor